MTDHKSNLKVFLYLDLGNSSPSMVSVVYTLQHLIISDDHIKHFTAAVLRSRRISPTFDLQLCDTC